MPSIETTHSNILLNFLISPRNRPYRHLLFIALIAVISVNRVLLVSVESIDRPVIMVLSSIAFTLVNLGAGYIIIYLFTPLFLLKKKYKTFILCMIGIMILIVAAEFLMEYILIYCYHLPMGEHAYLSKMNIIPITILSTITAYSIGMSGASFTVLLQHWKTTGQRVFELEKVSLQSEVQQLKNQINPNFLFRILDRASVLTKTNPEQVSQMLMLLSKILRYRLYDCTHEKVLLHADILLIEHLLNLESMRLDGFSFSISEKGDTKRTLIPPLLFVPLVEYVIRHIPENGEPSGLHLHFQVEDNKLKVNCLSFGLIGLKSSKDKDLSKMQRRLTILYGDKYILETTVQESGCTIYIMLYV